MTTITPSKTTIFAGFLKPSRGVRRIAQVAAVALLALPAQAIAADYFVEAGDVFEISDGGLADMRHRATVQLDGSISFPLMGSIKVAGLAPEKVRAKIQATLLGKPFRRRTPGAGDSLVVIDPDEVTVSLVEYRPVYINGDVSTPGQHVYRPLMTVRQALSLAGGYDIARFRNQNPAASAADLDVELNSLNLDLARSQARIMRLKAELANRATLDVNTEFGPTVAPAVIKSIMESEAELLKISLSDFALEKEFLQRTAAQADAQRKALSDQLLKEEQGNQADEVDLANMTKLYRGGGAINIRLNEARRAVLLSTTRKIQLSSQLTQIQHQKDEVLRQLERLGDQRRIKLLGLLQDSNANLNTVQAKLKGVTEKLGGTTTLRSQLLRGQGARPDIMIVRKSQTGRVRMVADEDTELQPGDVVEISLLIDK